MLILHGKINIIPVTFPDLVSDMFRSGLSTVFCVTVMLAAGSPGPALACDYGYCWGAVAFGPLGAAGYAVRRSTAPDAETQARQACGDTCVASEVFNDSCAALAADRDDQYQLGIADTRAKAEAAALESCRAMGLYCVTRVSACSQ